MQQVATDRNGNRYVTGSFGGTVDFDPSVSRIDGTDILSAQGKRDGFVAKYTQTMPWLGSESLVVSPIQESPMTLVAESLSTEKGMFSSRADSQQARPGLATSRSFRPVESMVLLQNSTQTPLNSVGQNLG